MKKIRVYPTIVDSYHYFLSSENMTFDEMIDRINRAPRPVNDAALKGSAFNDLIDMHIQDQDLETTETDYVINKDGLIFSFSRNICDEIARTVKGSLSQVFCKADIKTKYGVVELYGYLDYVYRDIVYELKTTGYYTFPKFHNNFQHKCYLYMLRNMGIEVKEATYIITDFRSVYKETYTWNDRMYNELLSDLNGFLDFVNRNRDQITYKNYLAL